MIIPFSRKYLHFPHFSCAFSLPIVHYFLNLAMGCFFTICFTSILSSCPLHSELHPSLFVSLIPHISFHIQILPKPLNYLYSSCSSITTVTIILGYKSRPTLAFLLSQPYLKSHVTFNNVSGLTLPHLQGTYSLEIWNSSLLPASHNPTISTTNILCSERPTP